MFKPDMTMLIGFVFGAFMLPLIYAELHKLGNS